VTSDEAGRPNGPGKYQPRGTCFHQRVVDYLYEKDLKPSGQLRCKECGEIFSDPVRNQKQTP